jgi:hypothetical protein
MRLRISWNLEKAAPAGWRRGDLHQRIDRFPIFCFDL